jgi:[ribosomal protein S18]-alanine N-acetyltransferase
MKIRPATAGDIPALMALEKEAATAAHWSEKQYQADFSNSGPALMALVIEDQGTPQGFLVARGVEREWAIENVVVRPSLRRRGLATRLLTEFLGTIRLQNAEAVFLEVRESNAAARKLYESLSFVQTGRRRGYYQNPQEDAILYKLDFNR